MQPLSQPHQQTSSNPSESMSTYDLQANLEHSCIDTSSAGHQIIFDTFLTENGSLAFNERKIRSEDVAFF